jgi:hypothetical protein
MPPKPAASGSPDLNHRLTAGMKLPGDITGTRAEVAAE